jgi:hypothetical protein
MDLRASRPGADEDIRGMGDRRRALDGHYGRFVEAKVVGHELGRIQYHLRIRRVSRHGNTRVEDRCARRNGSSHDARQAVAT